MRTTCPVCRTGQPTGVDYRAQTPVMMHRLFPTQAAARATPHGVLDIVACNACGFAWNRSFNPDLITYDDAYDNDQTNSAAFLAHVKARAVDVVAAVPGNQPIDYLEIGCGQGSFIGEVAMTAAGRLRSAEGFDPAWRGPDGTGPNGSRIHKVYFDQANRHRLTHAPTVAATRHTIEHVPDPVAFLTTIRAALGPESNTRLFIETPCIAWVLRHEAMQDLFYEHCSIFTADSLRYAMEKSGFRDVVVGHVFGGQYLWASGAAGQANDQPKAQPPSDLANLSKARERFTAKWSAAVAAAKANGPVAIWGAGAKGVTFALLTDPTATTFNCAIDINPGKQGLHLAGSGLQVLAPDAAAARGPKTIFVMNPNYLDEIGRLARDAGMSATLVPIN
jgi:hypothetical protein